jgi:adenosylcobinamide kinase/adenosylcobinamide-phosphate guanylyltransferase
MDVRLLGTGGPAGWPEPGCRCASCRRAAAGGGRRPGGVLVDGRLRIDPGQPPRGAPTGYAVAPVPGGWDITGPDGGRLLIAGAAGRVPDPPPGTLPYHLLLLDMLAGPAQLGALRARGLAGPGAVAAVRFADHRVASEAELARRAALWRVAVPGDGDTLAAAPARVPGAAGAGRAPGGGPHRTLVLGGARSGKSAEAELRLAAEPQVTYVAAGPWPDGAAPPADGPGADPEWARRVAAHRAARPARWATVESADVAGALGRLDGAVLVDGIGTWLTAVMTQAGAWPADGEPAGAAEVAARVDELVAAWRQTAARVVAVSDQVGDGVVPATPAGRLFRDQLGWLNQRLAAESEETVLVVAGRALSLPG